MAANFPLPSGVNKELSLHMWKWDSFWDSMREEATKFPDEVSESIEAGNMKVFDPPSDRIPFLDFTPQQQQDHDSGNAAVRKAMQDELTVARAHALAQFRLVYDKQLRESINANAAKVTFCQLLLGCPEPEVLVILKGDKAELLKLRRCNDIQRIAKVLEFASEGRMDPYEEVPEGSGNQQRLYIEAWKKLRLCDFSSPRELLQRMKELQTEMTKNNCVLDEFT